MRFIFFSLNHIKIKFIYFIMFLSIWDTESKLIELQSFSRIGCTCVLVVKLKLSSLRLRPRFEPMNPLHSHTHIYEARTLPWLPKWWQSFKDLLTRKLIIMRDHMQVIISNIPLKFPRQYKNDTTLSYFYQHNQPEIYVYNSVSVQSQEFQFTLLPMVLIYKTSIRIFFLILKILLKSSVVVSHIFKVSSHFVLGYLL